MTSRCTVSAATAHAPTQADPAGKWEIRSTGRAAHARPRSDCQLLDQSSLLLCPLPVFPYQAISRPVQPVRVTVRARLMWVGGRERTARWWAQAGRSSVTWWVLRAASVMMDDSEAEKARRTDSSQSRLLP